MLLYSPIKKKSIFKNPFLYLNYNLLECYISEFNEINSRKIKKSKKNHILVTKAIKKARNYKLLPNKIIKLL